MGDKRNGVRRRRKKKRRWKGRRVWEKDHTFVPTLLFTIKGYITNIMAVVNPPL